MSTRTSTQLTGGFGGLTALTNPLAGATSLVQAPSGTGGSNPLAAQGPQRCGDACRDPSVGYALRCRADLESASRATRRARCRPPGAAQATKRRHPAAVPAASASTCRTAWPADPAPKFDNQPEAQRVQARPAQARSAEDQAAPMSSRGAAKVEAPETDVKTADPKDASTEVKAVDTKESASWPTVELVR